MEHLDELGGGHVLATTVLNDGFSPYQTSGIGIRIAEELVGPASALLMSKIEISASRITTKASAKVTGIVRSQPRRPIRR